MTRTELPLSYVAMDGQSLSKNCNIGILERQHVGNILCNQEWTSSAILNFFYLSLLMFLYILRIFDTRNYQGY